MTFFVILNRSLFKHDFVYFQAGALVSNPDGGTNTYLKDDDTYVYDSGHSNRNYNWKK